MIVIPKLDAILRFQKTNHHCRTQRHSPEYVFFSGELSVYFKRENFNENFLSFAEISSSPPMDWTRELTIAKPKPVP
jgi:hypothetical protein